MLTRFAPTRRVLVALAALVVLIAALVDVRIIEPRVHVRWRGDIGESARAALERRYDLQQGELVQGTTWRYELHDRSEENVRALVDDPAVVDTAYIDRPTLTVPPRDIDVSAARLRALAGPAPSRLLPLRSVVLIAAGAALLWASTIAGYRRRRAAALAMILLAGAAAYAMPLGPDVRMGDADTYTATRDSFDNYAGVREIRFEAHLSHALLGRLDAFLGRTPDSPARALRLLMQAATAWFLLMLVTVGLVESWSAPAVRYLGLAIIGPSALMYFGYRELGHLSLNLAAYPLLVRGLRHGTAHLEASGLLAGLGSALHGFGLMSMAGAVLAALAAPLRGADRGRAAVTFVAWAVAAYLGWVAIYLIVLKLPLVGGHAEAIPLRPWFADAITDRVNAAIVSPRGARDVIVTALVVGMPLLAVAASRGKRFPAETRMALLYSAPSVALAILFWPIQGLAVEMDLVFAAFPGLYALAWLCAHDARRTIMAAAVLAFAHVVFWRIVLDSAFVNSRV